VIQDNDYNIIKPVDNLKNVGALTPVDRRDEKRRRQGQKDKRRAATDQRNLSDAQQDETSRSDNDQAEQGSIDYRA
jgi:hypothetical protein